MWLENSRPEGIMANGRKRIGRLTHLLGEFSILLLRFLAFFLLARLRVLERLPHDNVVNRSPEPSHGGERVGLVHIPWGVLLSLVMQKIVHNLRVVVFLIATLIVTEFINVERLVTIIALLDIRGEEVLLVRSSVNGAWVVMIPTLRSLVFHQ